MLNVQLNDQFRVDEKSDDHRVVKNDEKSRDIIFDQVDQHLLVFLKKSIIFDQNFNDVDDSMQMFLKSERIQL